MNTSLLNPTAGFSVAFTAAQQHLARRYAAQQLSEAQAETIYLGTLARSALQTFLSEMYIDLDLSASASDHPLLRQLNAPFDLELPELGPLICLPAQEQTITAGDRLPLPFLASPALGYVVVLFSGEPTTCRLYGYLPAAASTETATDFSLSQLQAIEQLPEYLYSLEAYLEILPKLMGTEAFVSTADAIVMMERLKDLPLCQRKAALLKIYPQLDDQVSNVLKYLNTLWGDLVNLKDWLDGQWRGAWTNLQDELTALAYPNLAVSFAGQTRSSETPIHRSLCEGISVISLGGQDLRLVIRRLPQDKKLVDVAIEVYPQEGEATLPTGLNFRLFDDQNTVIDTQHIVGDRQLSLELEGEIGEGFLLEFSFGDILVQKYVQI